MQEQLTVRSNACKLQRCVSCANDARDMSAMAITRISGVVVGIRRVLSIVVVAHKIIAISNTAVFAKAAAQSGMHVIDACINNAYFDALASDTTHRCWLRGGVISYRVPRLDTYPNSSLTLLIPVAL